MKIFKLLKETDSVSSSEDAEDHVVTVHCKIVQILRETLHFLKIYIYFLLAITLQ